MYMTEKSLVRIGAAVLVLFLSVSCVDQHDADVALSHEVSDVDGIDGSVSADALSIDPRSPVPESVKESGDRDPEKGISVSYCAVMGVEANTRFKLYDWDTGDSVWVRKGDDYRGYRVVGLDPDTEEDNLLLERGEYWYSYPLELLDLGKPRRKPTVIPASEIPEGVDIMDYLESHAEPLNQDGMPENMPEINPYVDMDAAVRDSGSGDTMPFK